MAHEKVDDAVVERVYRRVLAGMGLLVLHSGHMSKIFRKLMGTTCGLLWRDDDRERVWTVAPGHPIARGLPARVFEIPQQEMYGEFFDIPQPRGTCFYLLVRGRRGIPLRLLLAARRRKYLLLLTRA